MCEDLRQMRANYRHYLIELTSIYIRSWSMRGLCVRSTTGHWMASFPEHEMISRQGNSLPRKHVAEIRVAARHLFFHAIPPHQGRVHGTLCRSLADEHFATQKNARGSQMKVAVKVYTLSTTGASTHSLQMLIPFRMLTMPYHIY